MLSLPLLACVLSIGASAEPTITFRQPAMTLERLLPKLGEAAGVKMEADKSIKNEVVLVQVKDVPAKDLLDRLAKAACGEWENQDGKLLLKLNAVQDRAERTADWQRNLAELRSKISGLAEQIGLGRGPRKAIFGYADQQVYRILQMVPLEPIARLGQMDSIVFAYPASGSQYPLLAACVPIAQEMLAKTPNRQPGDLAKVMLLVDRPRQINLRAKAIRNDGVVLAESGLHLYDQTKPALAPPIGLPNPEARIAVPDSRRAMVDKIGLFASKGRCVGWSMTSSEDYTSVSFLEPYFNPSGYSRLTTEQEDMLRNPDEVEPLSIGLGDALSAFADSQNTNLVACLPDSAENQACIDLKGEPSTAAKVAQEASGWGVDIRLEGKWCTIRPQAPSEARDLRLNRKALKSVVNQAGYQKLPPLSLLSSYCAAQPLIDLDQSFEMTWLRMSCPETAKAIYNTVPDRCLLRFWGLLGPAIQTKLAAGGSVSYSSLSPDQKRMLVKAMPKMYCKIDPATPAQTYVPDAPPIGNVTDDFSEIVPFPYALQAEIVGSSSTRDTLLGIAENGERSVFDFTKGAVEMSLPCDPLTPGVFLIEAPRLVFPYYQPGKRTALKLQVRLLNKPERLNSLTFTHNLYDDRIPDNALLFKRSELPPTYLKWLNTQLKKLQHLEQYLDSRNPQEKQP